MVQHHFLLVSCPAPGHVNPSLQLAKRLVRTGAYVTFATSVHGHRRMIDSTPPSLDGLSYASYSDGYDDGPNQTDNPDLVMDRIKRIGSQSLSDLIPSLAHPRPITCLIYAVLLPWAAEVAREHRVPSALLWIQPASVFTIFSYNYCHVGHDLLNKDPSISIKLPGLPLLSHQDLPSFFHVSSPHRSVMSTFKDHFLRLQEEPNPILLVNSFDQIEGDAIRAVDMRNLEVFAVGPLIPSSLEGEEEDEKSYGCDLFRDSVDRVDYIEWLNSKPKSSVVYVAFGSMVELPSKQKEEILRGLVESGRPFLWAGRPQLSLEEFVATSQEEEGERLDSRGGQGGINGLVVEWCSQTKVLSHGAVGCFVSHCGWNSTLESMAGGVPVVGCPRWSDQTTVAKLVEDVWKFGVRAKEEEEGIVKSEEIKRCLEEVMGRGERGKEMRRNAWRLKDLVKEVMKKEDGCCWKSLEAFMEKLGNRSKNDER